MPADGETKPTTVRLDPELRALVEAIGESQERNFSQQIAFMLKRYIAEHPDVVPEGWQKGRAKKAGKP